MEVERTKIVRKGSKDYNNPEYILKCENCGYVFIAKRNEGTGQLSQYNELIFLYHCPERKSRCYAGEGNRRLPH